jgi:hypothetical protein
MRVLTQPPLVGAPVPVEHGLVTKGTQDLQSCEGLVTFNTRWAWLLSILFGERKHSTQGKDFGSRLDVGDRGPEGVGCGRV